MGPILMPVSMVDTEPMVPTLMPMEPTPILTTARGLLMLSLRLMPTMVLTDTVSPMLDMAMVLAMLDLLAMEPTPILTTARGLLMLSPRLMLLISMDLMDMLDTGMLLPTPMVPTPMPMDLDMASKMSTPPIRVAHQVQTPKLKSKQNR